MSPAMTSHGDRVVTMGPVGHSGQRSATPDETGSANISVAMRKKLQGRQQRTSHFIH